MQKNSLNKVLLIGRLGASPEARYTSAGIPVVSFSLATNEYWKQKDGKQTEKVEWHSVVVWDKLAEMPVLDLDLSDPRLLPYCSGCG